MEDDTSKFLSDVFENNPYLVEVNGLDDSGSIYIFDSAKEEQSFYKSAKGCIMMKSIGKDCGGGGGGSGGGTPSRSLYNSQNLRIYVDSYLNKEIDYTSFCYYSTGTSANELRIKDFNNIETNAWRFRNSSFSCFPSGMSNMSDKLSSLQVSESVAVVTIYQDHNYKGRSKKFFRRDVGLKDPKDNGRFPYWVIDPDTKWMVIGRLKNMKLGFLDSANWDDCVSSIKLNL